MEFVPLYISANHLGLKRVVFDPVRKVRILLNGVTRHGMESADPERSGEPLAYYHRNGPLGDVFSSWQAPAGGGQVAIVGLGVGCMATYAQPGQRFTFYEIDPGVAKIAVDPQYFTFLSRCRGTWEIVLGDGRAELEKVDDKQLDMIILDAFEDDRMPAHLVSDEAVHMYLRKLVDAGLLVLPVTNVHTALQPEWRRLAAAEGCVCLARADLDVSEAERLAGKLASHYAVIARGEAAVAALAKRPGWTVA